MLLFSPNGSWAKKGIYSLSTKPQSPKHLRVSLHRETAIAGHNLVGKEAYNDNHYWEQQRKCKRTWESTIRKSYHSVSLYNQSNARLRTVLGSKMQTLRPWGHCRWLWQKPFKITAKESPPVTSLEEWFSEGGGHYQSFGQPFHIACLLALVKDWRRRLHVGKVPLLVAPRWVFQ